VIEVQNLCRRFGSFKAVDDVSFEVGAGEIFGYLGANGAGKSTTIRMLCGLLAPSSGRATVAGHDVAAHPDRVKRSIGYMSQRFSLYMDLPVAENIAFFGGAYGLAGAALRDRRDALMRLVDLEPYLGLVTGSLPGGIRQRLALVCALLHRPQIVFLDEPTAGVDPASRREFWSVIRGLAAEGVTVFVTTHYMDEAEYCGRIGLMADGRLRALDTPEGLKAAWVPGSVLSFGGDGLIEAVAAARRVPGVLAVEPFGARWQIRFDPDRVGERALRVALEGNGARHLDVAAASATLEDVFLAVVAREAA
jgi:ABC-2 type transport system ATP-binding protein